MRLGLDLDLDICLVTEDELCPNCDHVLDNSQDDLCRHCRTAERDGDFELYDRRRKMYKGKRL